MLGVKTRQNKVTPEQQPTVTLLRTKTAKDEQVLVTIAGVDRKVGATHLALSFALKASERGISCGVILPEESFEALKQYYVLSVREETSDRAGSTSRQFATFAGISIMCGVLPGDLEGFQLLIWDCGILTEGKRRFLSGDLRCIVSGGQALELAPLNALLAVASYEDLSNCAVCIRGASQEDFDFIHKQMAGKVSCIAVQYKPDWSDTTLREDLVVLLRLIGH